LWPRRASSISTPYFSQAAAGEPANYSLPFTTGDNVKHDFDVFVAPTSPNGNQACDTLVLMLDRTESLRMERALAERETMYSAVVDHAPIAILTQVDGLITYANPAALMMLSADWAGRAIGRPFSEFIIDEDRAAVRERIAALADAPGFAEFRHYRLVALDAQVRDVELAAISVTRDGKQLVELFCVDVTERRLAEEKVRQLNETLELRVAERTSELEAFTTSVSHDLRAPARQVMSAADIMLRKLERPEANIVPMLTALRATAERMNRTIDALLELSRLGRAGIVPSIWPMGAMVDEIRSELSAELSTRSLSWRIGALPRVFADPQLLRMVMVNLIGNALKFSRNKPVSVIEIWAEEYEQMTAICVRDNGAGFEMNQVDKLFQMFSRLHSTVDFEGTGVGLAHCKRIIERHGGKISAHATPDKGATVRFTLPRDEGTS
jgi:PAS domain S-box-containing protein